MDFKKIVNAAAEAIFVLDKNGKFIFVNRHALQRSGYKEKDILGKNALRLIPRSQWEQATSTFNKILSGSQVKSVEFPVRYRSGRVVIMEFTGKPLKENGKLVGAVGTARDITKRKEAEQQLEQSQDMLRFVMDALPMRVFWKDRHSVYLGCNRAFAEDSGHKSPGKIIGKTDFDMPWKEQAKRYVQDDRRVITTGKSKLNYEEPQSGPGGVMRWLKTSKRPLKDLNGRIIGVLGVYEDITAEKRIKDALTEKVKELERFQKFAVGRELKMVELKKKLKAVGKR